MTIENKQPLTDYCNDNELSYKRYQTKFVDGHGLVFDSAYRLAHLPLVAPDHPRVITQKPGSKYYNGVHDLLYSIAMPIPSDRLLTAERFVRLYDEIKATTFAHKISWETFDQRKDKLHATICGSMSIGQAPNIDNRIYQQLRTVGPVAISIRGMFSGNLNIGRLYLKVYPELRNGKNMCHEIQGIFDSPLTDLYVVGLLNFVEELNARETQSLKKLIDLWWNVELVQLRLDSLWLLKSKDDLVLDGAIDQIIPLI